MSHKPTCRCPEGDFRFLIDNISNGENEALAAMLRIRREYRKQRRLLEEIRASNRRPTFGSYQHEKIWRAKLRKLIEGRKE